MPRPQTGRERPHRLPLDAYRGRVVVSLTACIKDRAEAFTESDTVASCIEPLRTATEKHHCIVPVYCFMPDHLHLILSGRTVAADTWRAMGAFKQQSGYWFGQNRPTFGWQKDFYDHVIRSFEDRAAHVRYILDNPVRAGLVKVWSDYPYRGSIGIALADVLADAAGW